MIYILDKNKNPLMPTERHGKIRKLLNEGKAKVVKQIPFTYDFAMQKKIIICLP